MCSDSPFSMIFKNGQKIYTSTLAKMQLTPPIGSEIFVGNIPRDVMEDVLLPAFSVCGPIYQLRLMVSYNEYNRGFGFILFFNVKDAELAVHTLNGTRLTGQNCTRTLKVAFSIDNRRLFFGNIPKTCTVEELKDIVKSVVTGVVDVLMFPDRTDPSLNRGFAFVEFESHEKAAIARRMLVSVRFEDWSPGIDWRVDWADPEPKVDSRVIQKVTRLFVRNLPHKWSSGQLRELIEPYLVATPPTRVYKAPNYAFIHFETRTHAEIALSTLGPILGRYSTPGRQVTVQWARPTEYSKANLYNSIPDHRCQSVPARRRKLVLMASQSSRPGSSHAN